GPPLSLAGAPARAPGQAQLGGGRAEGGGGAVAPHRVRRARRRWPVKTTASVRERLRTQLADLKMPGALEALDDLLARIEGGHLSAAAALEALLGAQLTLRNTRRLVAAMRSSRLPAVKTLADFDFTFQPSLKLAISLAIAAAQSGRRVYYGTLADIVPSLEEAQQA